MWSNQYWYYNIRCDANYSRSVPTEKIVVFLEGISVLKKKGALTFTNQPNFPWLNIACVNSNDGNFTGDLTTQTDNINLITIVASKPSLENEGKYLGLLKSIADKFRSELVLEEDDEGNENIMLS